MTRRFVLIAAALLALLFAVPARADVGSDASKFVSSLAQNAIEKIAKAQLPEDERTRVLRAMLHENFDMGAINAFVTGRFWRQASDAQKAEFAKTFEDYLVITWSKRFKDYGGQTMDVVGAQPPDESGAISVDTRILDQGKPIYNVTWRVRAKDGSFKAVDIVVEGVSMAITQRSDFLAKLQRDGMDGLLVALKEKVDDIRAGKIEPPMAVKPAGK
ncbi:MAG: ABC transporter substrate-binding protein [Rhodospirillales bacterium]|nr:ABC transporter substrate-binding protein [Rhodospirillales bacterium]